MTNTNGLCYMCARYYSPDMRRFINTDIITSKISNAVTLNRYAYANGNPVSNVDLSEFGILDIVNKVSKVLVVTATIVAAAAVIASMDGGVALITNSVRARVDKMCKNTTIADELIPRGWSKTDSEVFKAFFGAVDDASAYMILENIADEGNRKK